MGKPYLQEGTLKKLGLLFAILTAALAVTGTARAVSTARFVGTPTCTADNHGNVACTARVAGLTERGDLAYVFYQTEWACIADPSIKVVADNGLTTAEVIQNGRPFTVSNGARHPRFYEIIFGIDFGCAGDAWTAVRYTNVTIVLLFSNLNYNLGTVYPS